MIILYNQRYINGINIGLMGLNEYTTVLPHFPIILYAHESLLNGIPVYRRHAGKPLPHVHTHTPFKVQPSKLQVSEPSAKPKRAGLDGSLWADLEAIRDGLNQWAACQTGGTPI